MSRNDIKVGLSKFIIFVLPIVIVLICLYIKVSNYEAYRSMVREDALVENLTCVASLLASVFALSVAGRFLKDHHRIYGWLYVLVFIFFFFVGMEEISWGQRIFHTKTPEYMVEHNSQSETNIHNIRSIHYLMTASYYLVGLAGTLSWILLRLPWLKSLKHQARYFLPDWYLSLYFFFSFFIAFFLARVEDLGRFGFFNWRDIETAEMLMSFGFCLFTMAAKYRQLHEVRVELFPVEEPACVETVAGLASNKGR
jgi:hypothetical protein